MWIAAIPPSILLMTLVALAGCFLFLLLLVACSPGAARRITRLLVNVFTVIYGERNQACQKSYRQYSRHSSRGRKRSV